MVSINININTTEIYCLNPQEQKINWQTNVCFDFLMKTMKLFDESNSLVMFLKNINEKCYLGMS